MNFPLATLLLLLLATTACESPVTPADAGPDSAETARQALKEVLQQTGVRDHEIAHQRDEIG